MLLYSYACPDKVNPQGKLIKIGCGGFWDESKPAGCPLCGGLVVVLQEVHVVGLTSRAPSATE